MDIVKIKKNRLARTLLSKVLTKRATLVIEKWIGPYLKPNDSILDIGAGSCTIVDQLQQRNHQVTALEIKNYSFVKHIKPVIYDGKVIPFADSHFDVALLCTVLHHTPEPEKILQEAKRVSERVILVEDIYSNPFQKLLTFFADSLINLEFKGHPHTNKTDAAWKKTFAALGLKLVDARYFRVFLFFTQVVYYLEKE